MTLAVQQLMLDIIRVRDRFHDAVFGSGDVQRAVGLLAEDAALTMLPAGIAATGADDVRRLLAEDLVPHRPPDLVFRRLSRTGDRWRVAQEDLVTFTHDRELPWLLPGVPPTHRSAEVLACSMVTVRNARIATHRTLWDGVGLRVQLGITGSEIDARLR